MAHRRGCRVSQLTWQDGLNAKPSDKLSADLVYLQQRLRPIQDVVRRQEHLVMTVFCGNNGGMACYMLSEMTAVP